MDNKARFTGKIVYASETIRGCNSLREWSLKKYVMEIPNSTGKPMDKITFDVWDSNIKKFDIKVNDFVSVVIAISASEFKGSWKNKFVCVAAEKKN